MIKFYDTCSLLDLQESIFQFDSKFLISSITIKELEQIKTSGTKDEEIKWNARNILRLLEQNENKYDIITYKNAFDSILISSFDMPITSDTQIIISAYQAFKNIDGIFVTSDLACKKIAECIGLKTEYTFSNNKDEYTGYIVIKMDDKELANFYNDTLINNKNIYNLLINQYLLISSYDLKSYSNQIIDKYKWAGDHYIKVPFCKAQSKMFGKITPKNGDDYQQIALDSLASNQITMLRGPAGSGKSYIAFGHMFSLLEQGKIDKIVIFCNTVATKGSAKLGFYPGSRTEKLLDSQIGNLLESKLGDKVIVEQLIEHGQLILLPMSDIRGYDTTGMNAAVYISEAQNLDIELMRLALQRIGEDSICIIDGDSSAQVDLSMYAGTHNGMRRVSKIFRDHDFYGEVTLKNIHRSPIAKLAQQL